MKQPEKLRGVKTCDRVSRVMKLAIKLSPVATDERKQLAFSSGDTLRVWSKVKDKDKFRLQAFEGIVLARKHGSSAGATFTVRKVSNGVGVERIFPLYSPMIDRIEVVRQARARRSKLYYVRDKAVRDIRRKMKSVTVKGEDTEATEETEGVE